MSGFRSRTGRLASCAIVDFDRLHRQLVIKLFLCATNRKGFQARRDRRGPRARFDMPASPDALSDGEVYWDGWFSGSPVIFPLV